MFGPSQSPIGHYGHYLIGQAWLYGGVYPIWDPFGTHLGHSGTLLCPMDHHGPLPIQAKGHKGTIPDLFNQSQTIQSHDIHDPSGSGIYGISMDDPRSHRSIDRSKVKHSNFDHLGSQSGVMLAPFGCCTWCVSLRVCGDLR
jgi:hypothetical protein